MAILRPRLVLFIAICCFCPTSISHAQNPATLHIIREAASIIPGSYYKVGFLSIERPEELLRHEFCRSGFMGDKDSHILQRLKEGTLEQKVNAARILWWGHSRR